MEERILVEVYVSTAQQSFDVFLPCTCTLRECWDVLFPMLIKHTDHRFCPTKDTMMILSGENTVLNMESIVYKSGIQRASRIILL